MKELETSSCEWNLEEITQQTYSPSGRALLIEAFQRTFTCVDVDGGWKHGCLGGKKVITTGNLAKLANKSTATDSNRSTFISLN